MGNGCEEKAKGNRNGWKNKRVLKRREREMWSNNV